MSIFAIGDLHLSFDSRINKPMDIYGGEWVNHTEKLKKHWQENIRCEDTVIIAGDVSWAMRIDEAMKDLKWIDKLPGKKIIIKGNHDLWWTGIGKLNGLFKSIFFLQNDIFETEGIAICGSRGWVCPGNDAFEEKDEKIYRREIMRLETSLKLAKKRGIEDIVGVLHYPPTNEKHQPSEFTKLFSKYNVEKVVYGHLHGEEVLKSRKKFKIDGVSYKLVSIDALGCNPLKIK